MSTLGTLLTSTFGIFLVGIVLRRTRALPSDAPVVLNRVVTHATMPALSFTVLARASISFEMGGAILATSCALAAALASGLLLIRLSRLERQSQGSFLLTSTFGNTGFLGIPVVLALYPGNASAAATAVLINIIDATLLLWTLGVVLAGRFGQSHALGAREVLKRLFAQPLLWAVGLGLLVSFGEWTLPGWLASPLTLLGQATAPLVFLSLGLGLSFSALRGRLVPIGVASKIKLALSPAVALLAARTLGLDAQAASVATLQAAMPTALVSAIIAREQGCDAALATAIAATTTSLSLVSLPLVIAVLA